MSKSQTLDRLLSKLGIASRTRGAEMIRSGRVRVKGKIVRDPAFWVSWPDESVTIDQEEIKKMEGRFFLFHKPCGYITSHSDEKGRKTVFDLLPMELGFLHAVGRLDRATSGLLLLTNETEISDFLTDPTNKIPRIYKVKIWGHPSAEKLDMAIQGIEDAGEILKCDSVTIEKQTKRETQVEVVLRQGKNREIRRIFEAIGHKVTGLVRVQYGPFELGALPLGAWEEVPMAKVKKELGFG